MKVDRELMRVADVAHLMGLTTGRVYQLIAAGEIPVVRIGGSLRIPRDAWDAWIASQRDAALRAIGPVADGPAAAGGSPPATGTRGSTASEGRPQ